MNGDLWRMGCGCGEYDAGCQVFGNGFSQERSDIVTPEAAVPCEFEPTVAVAHQIS